MIESRGPGHFEALYRASSDPWDLARSPYEAGKYAHTIGMLGGRCFAAGLEVGCSVGVLTRLLAPRCAELLAIDIIDAPLTAARARCADLGHVHFVRMRAPQEWPNRTFDLIVLSEILYFLSPSDVRHCASRVVTSSRPDATVILVNWLGCTGDPCTGDEAADIFIAAVGGSLRRVQGDRAGQYRIDRLIRNS